MRNASPWILASGFIFTVVACGEGTTPPSNTNPDASAGQDAAQGAPDSGFEEPDVGPLDTGPEPDAGEPIDSGVAPMVINGGNVSGAWCGAIDVTAAVTVPMGETLSICAGSNVTLANNTPRVRITVNGTLRIEGSMASTVRFTSSGTWDGIKVSGRLEGGGFSISNASIGLDGLPGSSIEVDGVTISRVQRGFQLENGGTLNHTTVTGGGTNAVTGGVLRMTDSIIDIGIPRSGPDCVDWAGGGAELDHVRFTGCHCPIHINRASLPINVSNSIFDGASVPVMIARSTAVFRGNHFLSSGPEFLDIGGGITADVAGNYWGGGAPGISSGNQGQFTGANDYSTTPFPGAGPR